MKTIANMDIIHDVLFPTIDEFNITLPADRKLEKSPNTVLLGEGALLDSIQLVSFIVAAEEALMELTGKDITFVTSKAISQNDSPFSSITSLAKYVDGLLT